MSAEKAGLRAEAGRLAASALGRRAEARWTEEPLQAEGCAPTPGEEEGSGMVGPALKPQPFSLQSRSASPRGRGSPQTSGDTGTWAPHLVGGLPPPCRPRPSAPGGPQVPAAVRLQRAQHRHLGGQRPQQHVHRVRGPPGKALGGAGVLVCARRVPRATPGPQVHRLGLAVLVLLLVLVLVVLRAVGFLRVVSRPLETEPLFLV